jgi:Mg-chelatase subunit ChlD
VTVSFSMILHYPIWLLLTIPLGIALWLWRLPGPLLQALRITSVVLIILAMCGLAIKLPARAGTVVVVVDRSESMPPNSDSSHKEAINIIRSAIGGDQRLAVVSYGRTSSIEPASQTTEFAGFISDVGRDESNLSEALEKALALIPQGSPGRIVVLSDGRWTGKDPANAAWRAAARGISIDYRMLERSAANDLAIAQIEAPGTVSPGESFMINGWISSPVSQEITYELLRGNERLAAGKRNVSSGLTRLTFRDQAADPGTYSYRLRVTSAAEDPVPENNSARLLIGINGPKPLLCLTTSADSGTARLLTAGGLKVRTISPESFSWSVEELSNYSALIVENVSADKIGVRGMQNIVAWVKETGAGLMITGGKNSYGPGGYYKSELEPIMPVSMELKREHRKLSMAIVVAMDRSGSMAVPVGGGRTKMDLANIAAVQVLDLMSPMDEFGVIAIDSSPHTIVNLAPPANVAAIRDDILRIDSQGGGIFIYEALSASAKMLLDAKAGTRHIILFADAADSEEPGKYQELITKCEQAGITISVVGLGKPTDSDANLLRDIAHRGGGRIFFTENPEELPRLFAQDTFVVARSTFVDEATPVEFTGGAVSITGKQFATPPSLGGYNLCYLRPEANLGAITVDDYKAPVIASWQAGLGRVLCYTGEADGAYTGAIAKWKDVGELFTSLARWTAGETNTLPGNLLVTQELKNGTAVVQLHLDPERESEPFNELPSLSILRGVVGSKPEVERTALRWSSADTLDAEIPLRGNETALATVDVAGTGRLTLSPVCLPYSTEFKPVEPDSGRLALDQLGKATGGRERVNLAGVWNDLPRQSRLFEMTPWLLTMVLLLLLAEVLERRTGLISLRRFVRLRTRRPPAEVVAVTPPYKVANELEVRWWRRPARAKTVSSAVGSAQIDSNEMSDTLVAAPEMAEMKKSEPGLDDALVQARRQARSRTRPRKDVP